MKSSTKTVLYAKVKVGKEDRQWPVAAFNSDREARKFAPSYYELYMSGSGTALHELTPDAVLDPDGKPLPGLRFSLLTLPYNPDLAPSSSVQFD